MPKEKLEFKTAEDYKKFKASADAAGVKMSGEPFKSMGELHQEILYKTGQQLVTLGRYMERVTDADIKAYEKRFPAPAKADKGTE